MYCARVDGVFYGWCDSTRLLAWLDSPNHT
jgi:hypothetical protein